MLRVEKPFEEKFKNKTEADERKLIDYETAKFINKMGKLNETLKIVKVTHINIRINHPVNITYKTWWQRLAAKIGKFFYDMFHPIKVNEEIKEINNK